MCGGVFSSDASRVNRKAERVPCEVHVVGIGIRGPRLVTRGIKACNRVIFRIKNLHTVVDFDAAVGRQEIQATLDRVVWRRTERMQVSPIFGKYRIVTLITGDIVFLDLSPKDLWVYSDPLGNPFQGVGYFGLLLLCRYVSRRI